MANFNQCLQEYLVDFILNCPETCFVKDENKTVITIPFEEFFEKITENLRSEIHQIIESEEFTKAVKQRLEKSDNFTAKKIDDISGLIISIKN